MTRDTPELSIVIPAFEEAAKIRDDIRAAHAFVQRCFAGRGEIIVVDDGSRDRTAALASEQRVHTPNLTVLTHTPNRGKGYALRRGVAASRGRIILSVDAGSCVPLEQARRGIGLVENGTDIAHGSRRQQESRVESPQRLYRRVGSRVFRSALGLGMGIPRQLRDTQCGFKVYRGDVGRELYAACFTDGFMLDIELIRRAHRAGLRVREFGVHWSADHDTRYAPVRGTVRNMRELVRIRART